MSLLTLFQLNLETGSIEVVSNTKLAFMEWCQVWEPGLPVNPGVLGQADQQQLLWGTPSPLWTGGGTPSVVHQMRIRHWFRSWSV